MPVLEMLVKEARHSTFACLKYRERNRFQICHRIPQTTARLVEMKFSGAHCTMTHFIVDTNLP